MMYVRKSALMGAVLLVQAIVVYGQTASRDPRIGYVYPAGAQQGSVVLLTVGGQFLRGATEVYVSGDHVTASVVKYCKPINNLQKEQRQLIQSRLTDVREKRMAELSAQTSPRRGRSTRKTSNQATPAATTPKKTPASTGKKVTMPDHPLLYDLDSCSLRELAHIANIILAPRQKKQPNRQISELMIVEIHVGPKARIGQRELRIKTPTGFTNPMVFQIGVLTEIRELEPNGGDALGTNLAVLRNVPKGKPLNLPVVLNGQILPGDIDRFRLRARQGQQLVIQAHARSLIPYLADAVPGWFQATLALYDARGQEVAFVDDYRFNPDPVLFFKIPKTGEYELEIRDSVYRGREDFIYRITVGEQPFVTQAFPLGAQEGEKKAISISGWNLAETRLALDTRPGNRSIRQAVYYQGKHPSNSIAYQVDTLPGIGEVESNDTIKNAQSVELPKIVNGRIDTAGDRDIYQFKGRARDRIAIEVYARRLNSPLDSLVRLTDVTGTVVAWNDDYVIKESHLHKNMRGLLTHHADSYVTAKLPKSGTYYVHLADAQHQGGKAYAYRLRLSEPQPDFSLRVTPSSLNAQGGSIVPLRVQALRRDGYVGPIDVMPTDASKGVEVHGGRIPAGQDGVTVTVRIPNESDNQPLSLALQGQARIGGRLIRHAVVPADDLMQAFLYRHLVPAQELLISIQKGRGRVWSVEQKGSSPVCIAQGGVARVHLKTRKNAITKETRLVLKNAVAQLSLHDVKNVPDGFTFQVKAKKDIDTDLAGNLIIEMVREYRPKQKDGTLAKTKRRWSMGFLPAIPFEVTSL
jgi:hypothetical protein